MIGTPPGVTSFDYTCIKLNQPEPKVGFEPTRAYHTNVNGEPSRIRTCDIFIKSEAL